MGSTIPVFAGLGSELLFEAATQAQAFNDARCPQGQVLVGACHQVFVEEITAASSQEPLNIELDDFGRPEDVFDPDQRYFHHPAVQHASLCLTQLLRHQSRNLNDFVSATQSDVAASGFCIGLFAAVAVATARGSLEYLTRAVECFRASVLLGIAVERSQRSLGRSNPLLPWSLVVKNVSEEQIDGLISTYSSERDHSSPIYISAKNSSSCFTISGQGDILQEFIDTAVPKNCAVRPTNLYSLYHSRSHLRQCRDQFQEEFHSRSLPFPGRSDLVCPIVSTVDGSLVRPDTDPSTSSDLLSDIVDMILMERTDWEAVQNSILNLAQEAGPRTGLVTVCNYGPGYGALSHRRDLDDVVRVLDVSQQVMDKRTNETDIAIVGMGVDLPGAPNAETLWANLMAGKSFCSEIPSERFHIEDYCTADGASPLDEGRSMGTKFGNFLEDPFLFDHELFGVSPREAPSIDPQQRLMLQAVYRALENAGYVPDSTPSFSRETFGCFIGNATLDYVDNLKNSIDVYYSPGTLRAFLSGRISYAFKWSGPSVTIDTACSSSLVALHQAARALAAGDCRAAVVGGVNIMTSPDMFLGLDKAHFLSPTGQCKSFSSAADGYCRGEGTAAFVLKRLPDAVRENDRILGVIKSTAVNQCGNSTSITHPHSPTQESLFRTLLSTTDISPLDVSVVEAHGTGTQAGDPAELRSIRAVLSPAGRRTSSNPLHVGSLKANIGHCEAASGAAALAKLLLMLRHGHVPPQPILGDLNPAIDPFDTDHTTISPEAHAWTPPKGTPRIALLNNFGAAGSNAALLLQEYLPVASTKALGEVHKDATDMTFVIGCAAKSAERLETLRSSLVDFLSAEGSELDLADVAYTLTARRMLGKYRLSVAAASVPELVEKLGKAKITAVESKRRGNVFLFSGQGSQYLEMGRGLMSLSPRFRASVLRAHQLLKEWGLPSCLEVIEPQDLENVDMKDKDTLQALQTGVFVLEVAVADLLISLGVQPGMVTGHSLGEYAALVTAGVLDFRSGLWLVAERARLIVEKCELWKTGMLAANMSAEKIKGSILKRKEFQELAISCENSGGDCVVGGDVEILKRLKISLSDEFKARSTLLNVPIAYHTSALDPILKDLKRAASSVTLSAPDIPIASNTLGRVVNPGENVFTPDYFAEHCRNTVAFDQGIVDVLASEEDFASGRWIEVGPHPQLLPMVSARLTGKSAQKFPVLKKDRRCHHTLADIFADIYCDDAAEDVSWRDIFHDLSTNPKLIDLPLTPMIREKYFVPLPRETAQTKESAKSGEPDTPFTMIEHMSTPVGDAVASYETSIYRLARLIKGHLVCGQALCPGSVYGEMALAAATHASGSASGDNIFKISDISFTRPLLYSGGSSQVVRISLKATSDDDEQIFEISSTNSASEDAKLHCSGTLKRQSLSKASSKQRNTEQSLARRKTQFTDGSQQSFMTNIMYKIFGRVVDYSDEYQAVQKIYMDENAEEVFAECKIPQSAGDDHYAGQPVLLDTMLHVAGFAMNLNVDKDSVCICHSVHSSTLFRKIRANQAFDVHCSNFTSTTDANLIMADAHAVDETGVIAVIKGMHFRRQKLAKIQAAFEFATRFSAQPGKTPAVSPLPSPPVLSVLPTIDVEPVGSEDVTVVASDDEDNATSASVIQVLAETTGVKADRINSKTELSAIGVDSMMIFEIEKRITEIYRRKLSPADLSACDTVGDMELLVRDSACSSGTSSKSVSPSRSVSRGGRRGAPGNAPLQKLTPEDKTSWYDDHDVSTQEPEPEVSLATITLLQTRLRLGEQPEVVQSTGSARAPLYLVHPGAGMCHEYYRIGRLNRTVKAIHDPRIFTHSVNDDWASVLDMAEVYCKIILESQRSLPSPEIVLGGYSFGAVVAFETARLLAQSNACSVRGVIMIDAPPPFDHTPIARETIDAAMANKHQQSSRPRSKDRAEFEEAIGALAVRNNLRRAALLAKYQVDRSGPMPRVVLLRSSRGFGVPDKEFPENEWLHDRTDPSVGVREWEELIGSSIDCIDIPGDHFTPFEVENVQGTTAGVQKAIALLDRSLR